MENYSSQRTTGKRSWRDTPSTTLIVAMSAGVAGAAVASLLIAFWGEYQRQPDLATAVLESRVGELEELRPLLRSYGELDARVSSLEAMECPECEVRPARNAPEFVGIVLATIDRGGDGLNEAEISLALSNEHAKSLSATDLDRLRELERRFADLQLGNPGGDRGRQALRLDIREIREALF